MVHELIGHHVRIKEYRGTMSDQPFNDESLELLDAMEIGIDLSDYEQAVKQLAEELFKSSNEVLPELKVSVVQRSQIRPSLN
tara:strand:- start:96 stop:341 length:246 start_codon:yes stop_codon:yes gene_type:complete